MMYAVIAAGGRAGGRRRGRRAGGRAGGGRAGLINVYSGSRVFKKRLTDAVSELPQPA